MGSEKASMPTKCMHQMPVPMVSEPPTNQVMATRRSWLRTRLAKSSATYEANMAISTEAVTTPGE